ncbi:MAG TPA: S8 family peptidase [Candidatus Paceibacterota bacterium]
MITKKTPYFVVILLFFAFTQVSYATSDDTRYFVKSTSGWWKKSFGVRHNFDNGFTSDLTDFQLRVAKIFGVDVEPVKKLNVLPSQSEKSDLSQEPIISGKARAQRVKPTGQVPWGVKSVYNDPLLSKSSGGLNVNVAILDTGILKTHLDLKDRIKTCKDFSGPVGIANGKCDDKNGHGTHVAGIIAADGGSDGLGIYGMAPEANLFVYKVCSNNGTCWADDIAIALRMAADDGANVVNMSLGSDSPSQLITDATSYAVSKSVLVVAAAGNDGPYVGSIDYPGADSNVVAVGAVDKNIQIPDWSSRGNNSTSIPFVIEEKDIEFAAPGVNVESTWKDGGYAILSGTSMAAPHIAGLAAKEWQKDSLNPASATRELLQNLTADLLPIGDDNDSGFGFPHL